MKWRQSLIYFGIIFLAAFLILAFQNCSRYKPDAVEESSTANWKIPANDPNNAFPVNASSPNYTDCLNASGNDPCVFWKNPIASNNVAFGHFLNFGDNLDALQKIPMNLDTNLTSFENPFMLIYINTKGQTDISTRTVLNLKDPKLNLKISYAKDTADSANSQHIIAQEMAFYWLNYQGEFMEKKAGVFFPNSDASAMKSKPDIKLFNNSDNKILVNSYVDPDIAGDDSYNNNAFFSPKFDYIGLGKAIDKKNTYAHEVALSAEVYLHEMGHANLYHASHSETLDSINSNSQKKSKYMAICNLTIPNTKNYLVKVVLYSQLKIQSTEPYFTYSPTAIDPDCAKNEWTVTDGGNAFCTESNGCFRAIHEGAAYFHAHAILGDPYNPQRLSIGESICDDLSGFDSCDKGATVGFISRNPAHYAQTSWTIETFFNQSNLSPSVIRSLPFSAFDPQTAEKLYKGGYRFDVRDGREDQSSPMAAGEVHFIGYAYSTILWDLYTHPKINHGDFLKIFAEHLKMLNSNSNFQDAYDIFLTVDQNFFSAQYKTYIQQVFETRGVYLKK